MADNRSKPQEQGRGRSSPGVSRIAAVLDSFAVRAESRLSFTDILEITGLHRATCHAVLISLVEAGYLLRNEDKKFSLGYPMACLGSAAQDSLPSLDWALEPMRGIAEEFGIICSLLLLRGNEVLFRERVSHGDQDIWSSPRGTRIALRPPFGAVFLVNHSDAELEAWLDALTPQPTDEEIAALKQAIAFCRRRGFGVVERIGGRTGRGRTPARSLFESYGDAPVSTIPTLRYDGAQRDVASIHVPVIAGDGRVLFVLGAMGFAVPLSTHEIIRVARRLGDAAPYLAVKARSADARLSLTNGNGANPIEKRF